MRYHIDVKRLLVLGVSSAYYKHLLCHELTNGKKTCVLLYKICFKNS